MPNIDPQKWLDRVPGLEGGRRHGGMPPAEAAKLFDEILASGKDGVVALIDTLQEVDDGSDYKTRFVLHALASHTGAKDRPADRKKLEKIYAGELGGERSDAIKRFLVMQLHYFAGADSVNPIAAQLKSEDRMLIAAAGAALAAIGKPSAKALRAIREQVEGEARKTVDHALEQIQRSVTA